MPTELLNDVRLHYDTFGSGDTVVLTHGSWGDGDGWMPTVDILSRDFRVITWDRRGHTRSEDGAGPGSIDQDVADLASLIEHLGDGPVHAVGNSFGSVITYRLAINRPDLVTSGAVHEPAALALLEGSTDSAVKAVADPFFKELNIVGDLLMQGRNRDAPAHFMDAVAFGPGTWATFPEEAMAAIERNAPTFLDELQEQPYGQLDTHALASSDVPLLLTVGTESPDFLKVIVRLLSEQVPKARVEWIEGAGHVPHSTHPQAWSAVLKDFWQNEM